MTHESSIIPIEVKAGSTGQLKSLHLLMSLRNFLLAIRFNTDVPSVTSINTKSAIEKNASYTLLSLPLYLVNQLPRMLQEEVVRRK